MSKNKPTRRMQASVTASEHLLPAKVVTQTFRTLRRKVDLLRVIDDMILYQQERLIWLRDREIETGKPDREVSLSLRVLDFYLERRERLTRALQEQSPSPTDSDEEVREMPEEDYNDLLEVLRLHGEWLSRQTQSSADGAGPPSSSRADERGPG